MLFYLELIQENSGHRLTLCGKNKTEFKPYITTYFGRHNFATKKFENQLENLYFVNKWQVKNRLWNPKSEILQREASTDSIYAEKSLRIYSNSFAVIIDFINLQNQIMYHGLGKIGTKSDVNKFDWIRIRRNDFNGKKRILKVKPDSAFFKVSEMEKFFNKESHKLKPYKTINVHRGEYRDVYDGGLKVVRMKPTFTSSINSDEHLLDQLSKYVEKNEQFETV